MRSGSLRVSGPRKRGAVEMCCTADLSGPRSAGSRSVRMGRQYVCAPVVSDDIERPFGVKRLTQIAVNGEDALGFVERSREDVANG